MLDSKTNTQVARLAHLCDMGTTGSVDLRMRLKLIFKVMQTVNRVARKLV